MNLSDSVKNELAGTVAHDKTVLDDCLFEWLATHLENVLYRSLVMYWPMLIVLLYISKAPAIASKDVPAAVNPASNSLSNQWHKEQEPGSGSRALRRSILRRFLKYLAATPSTKYHDAV